MAILFSFSIPPEIPFREDKHPKDKCKDKEEIGQRIWVQYNESEVAPIKL